MESGESSIIQSGAGESDDKQAIQLGHSMYQLKKNLLLLATLVATVTYAAGLNLPGGSWLEDAPAEGQLAGDSILRETDYTRYIFFYYFNAISFAASLLVSLLLLLVQKEGDQDALILFMRGVMVVDLFGLMGAYAAGGSHDTFTTACASVLVSAVFAYVAAAFFNYMVMPDYVKQQARGAAAAASSNNKLEKDYEILMVLAIFAATIAYVAGLNPPGGFWRSTKPGAHHAAGDPVLQGPHPHRYMAFFFFNTAAFVASLLAIIFIVDYEKFNHARKKKRTEAGRVRVLFGLIITALLGLGGAYAAGSCRDRRHTAYVLSLVTPVVVTCIATNLTDIGSSFREGCQTCWDNQLIPWIKKSWPISIILPLFTKMESTEYKDLGKTREYIQLLATLVATIAYQAGLDPPGGVWSDTMDGHHSVGDPILLTTHPWRYKVFFYSNSAAFVSSLVIMVMLQNALLVRRHALEAVIILDLFGLIGAYAAGSCRDTSTSIYLLALAGAVLIYVVIHIVFFTLDPRYAMVGDEKLESTREVLLLLAILAATLTYQAGLTPPGGFWEKDDVTDGDHHAGFPVLQDQYPRRYKAFFYCNAASFMASSALIVLLLNPNLYRPGIRCYALFVCMVAGMLGLMGAYVAGSSLHVKTSIVVLALVSVVFLAVLYLGIRHRSKLTTTQGGGAGDVPKLDVLLDTLAATADYVIGLKPRRRQQVEDDDGGDGSDMATYLMLVGILAASVTYLTGLKPPGGLWRDDADGHSAGNPILYDTDKPRYNTFFYFNSTSLVASITVMAFLLERMMRGGGGGGGGGAAATTPPPWPMHTIMLLNMLALLVAFAAGSARDWVTSGVVMLMPIPILALVLLLFVSWEHKGDDGPTEQQHA